jgi:hypothetical protein
MKLLAIAIIAITPSLWPTAVLAADSQSLAIQKMNAMPLSFTKNLGQWDDRVLFRANAGGATMWFTKEGVTYQFTRRIPNGNIDDRRGTLRVPAGTRSVPLQGTPQLAVGDDQFGDTRDSIEQLVLTAKFVGANPNPAIIAEGQLKYKCNYFLGNDPSKWHTDVPNYEAIMLRDIYPGIDLKYSGDSAGQVAYEFITAPAADIAQIKVTYNGAEETSVDSDGKLILKTKWGNTVATIKTPSDGDLSGSASFSRLSKKTTGFEVEGVSQQAGGPKAGLIYSTYLGGSGDEDMGGDAKGGITVDAHGNAYVTGWTNSSDYPTRYPYQAYQGSYDVFVTKLYSSGSSLIYSTYIGGGGDEWGYDLSVDSDGGAYVSGYTTSSNFPTANPYQSAMQGGTYDAFVTKLSSSGTNLIYSTYLGGTGDDLGHGIMIDGSGNAYITGSTSSSNFPILNPYQATNQGYTNAFVTRLSGSGNNLVYSTYLGGEGYDEGLAIAVDGSGSTYVTGRTDSPNFPTMNPYQAINHGTHDVFVTKLSSSGSSLVYSTYLGGGGDEWGLSIVIDGSRCTYVVGTTSSNDFPVSSPYQAMNHGGEYGLDAFVTKLSISGNDLIYSTYLGGEGDDYGNCIAVNGSGNVFVAGFTASPDFPTQSPYQLTLHGWGDAYIVEFSNSGNGLIYGSYFGGGEADDGLDIALDGRDNAYLTGWTFSSNFPTLNPYQMHQDGSDAFVTKMDLAPVYICGNANTDATVDISDVVYLIAYIFSGGSAPNPVLAGDANCDSMVDISDVVYMIAYIFSGGAAPCAACK